MQACAELPGLRAASFRNWRRSRVSGNFLGGIVARSVSSQSRKQTWPENGTGTRQRTERFILGMSLEAAGDLEVLFLDCQQ